MTLVSMLLALGAPGEMLAAPASTLPVAAPTRSAQEMEADEALARITPLRVFLLTMDQGDEVWERFGHNAILIRNEATGEGIAWNWGLFSFDDVDFIPRFLRGTMEYSMGGMDPDAMVREYAAANRSVYANEVFLSLSQAAELDAFVRWNARPENRNYVYDYFRDNCSTRVRDVLDHALGGLLRDRFENRTTPRSYRWHARRLVQETLWIDQGLSFLLGTRGDRPISEWEAMFVPMVLMEHLEAVEVDDGEGGTRALLGPRQTLFEADRAPTPAGPPALSPGFPAFGIMLAVSLVLLGRLASPPRSGGDATGSSRPLGHRMRRGARIGLGATGLGWTLFSGALGLLLVLVWFTDHVFIHRNVNLLYLSPLAPVVGVLLVLSLVSPVRASGAAGRWGAVLGVALAVGGIIGASLQLLGVVSQGNAEVVAVALPVNLGLAVALVRLHLGNREKDRIVALP